MNDSSTNEPAAMNRVRYELGDSMIGADVLTSGPATIANIQSTVDDIHPSGLVDGQQAACNVTAVNNSNYETVNSVVNEHTVQRGFNGEGAPLNNEGVLNGVDRVGVDDSLLNVVKFSQWWFMWRRRCHKPQQ